MYDSFMSEEEKEQNPTYNIADEIKQRDRGIF